MELNYHLHSVLVGFWNDDLFSSFRNCEQHQKLKTDMIVEQNQYNFANQNNQKTQL